MVAKRHRAPQQPDIVVSDHGTRERAQHDDLKLVVVDRTMRDEIVATRAEIAAPTALHRMRDNGLLGKGDAAERRFRAGEWLLNLYTRTHPSEGVSDYQVIGRDTGEMSEAQAWNFRCWQETLRALEPWQWHVLGAIIIRNCMNASPLWVQRAQEALDALYEHREKLWVDTVMAGEY